jgi:hypothetical protein
MTLRSGRPSPIPRRGAFLLRGHQAPGPCDRRVRASVTGAAVRNAIDLLSPLIRTATLTWALNWGSKKQC